MKFTLIMIAIMLFAGTVLADPVEWPVSEGGNGHFYEAVRVNISIWISWQESNEAALALSHNGLNGHLATFTSAEEDQWFVENVLDTQDGTFEDRVYYIGGWGADDIINDGGRTGWIWITGESWGYENWAPGEPTPHREEVYLSYFYHWQEDPLMTGFNDLGQRHYGGYIVEYDEMPVIDLPPDSPVSSEHTSWGDVKALFR